MGRPSKYKEEFCKQLIDHMAQGFSFESFGAIAGVWKEALYNWVKKHENFANAKKEGTLRSMLFWEEMGIEGTKGMIKGFNVGSWIFNMKNRFSWKDKQEITTDDKGVTINYSAAPKKE